MPCTQFQPQNNPEPILGWSFQGKYGSLRSLSDFFEVSFWRKPRLNLSMARNGLLRGVKRDAHQRGTLWGPNSTEM